MNMPIVNPQANTQSDPVYEGEKVSSILVIDDDQALRTVLCNVLKDAGYNAVGASDGLMGLKQCAENKYDLVVSDMLMPNCDGVEFIVALRKQNPAAAIIAISGGGRIGAETYLRIAANLGVKAVLNKPFPMSTFIKTVNEVFERK